MPGALTAARPCHVRCFQALDEKISISTKKAAQLSKVGVPEFVDGSVFVVDDLWRVCGCVGIGAGFPRSGYCASHQR